MRLGEDWNRAVERLMQGHTMMYRYENIIMKPSIRRHFEGGLLFSFCYHLPVPVILCVCVCFFSLCAC